MVLASRPVVITHCALVYKTTGTIVTSEVYCISGSVIRVCNHAMLHHHLSIGTNLKVETSCQGHIRLSKNTDVRFSKRQATRCRHFSVSHASRHKAVRLVLLAVIAASHLVIDVTVNSQQAEHFHHRLIIGHQRTLKTSEGVCT